MSLWGRLRRAFSGAAAGKSPPGGPPQDPGPGDDPGASNASVPVERVLANADRLIQAGRTAEALAVLGRCSARSPDDVDLLLRQAEILRLRQQHALAVPLLRRATDLLEGGSTEARHQARFLLAQTLAEAGEPAEAREQLELVLSEDLRFPQARALYTRLGGTTTGAPATAHLGQGRGDAELPTLLGAFGVRHQRYQLARELGRGSAGTVYLARDTELERDVAIKLFHVRDREVGLAARAWNEARLTAAVRHPGVVAIYDLDDEHNLVVMELCTGGTLRQRLKGSPLPAPVALRRATELLGAVATVHGKGVVHGDLKPGNLLFRGLPGDGFEDRPVEEEPGGDRAPGDADQDLWLEEDRYGDLVIVDFGIARLQAETDPALLQAAGTLGYVAPERRRRGAPEFGPEADLYAVGAILLEMLLGALPLSRLQLLRGDALPLALGDPADPGTAAAALGPARAPVEALLRALLAQDPADRPTAAQALGLLRDLAPARR